MNSEFDSNKPHSDEICKVKAWRAISLTCMTEQGQFAGDGMLWSVETSIPGLLDYQFGVVNLLLENLDMEKAKKLIPSFRMFVILGEGLPPSRVALVQCCLKQARGIEGCVVRLQFVKIYDSNPVVTDTEEDA